MILSPSEYYESCKGQTRYMRDVDGPFDAKLAKGERKVLRKLEAAYCVALVNISDCYPIIEMNRTSKGRTYSMKRGDWEGLAKDAGAVLPFAVYPGPIATALTVRVSPDTLYVQAWAHAESAEKLSPVVFLAKGIYNWCADHGYKTLDIGTADEAGLIAFKQRLGFEARIL